MAANSSGTSYGEDQTLATLPAPPEFGRCLKVPHEAGVFHGSYTKATCTQESTTHTGKFEWYPGVVNGGFKTVIKPTTTATIETTGKLKVICTGESSNGTVTGPKTVNGVTITFTGCESAGKKCTGPGLGEAGEGEIVTAPLEGVISPDTVVSGSVIGAMPTDKMFTSGTVKWLEKAGKQKPESFLGGETDVLINSLEEQTAIKLKAIQTNEEAFEINGIA